MEEASTSRSAVQLSAFLSVLPSSSSSGYSSSQRILASPKLWKLLLDQLLLPGESAAPDSITVSISALYLVHCADDVDDTVKAVKKMESLVCCAIQCDPAMAKVRADLPVQRWQWQLTSFPLLLADERQRLHPLRCRTAGQIAFESLWSTAPSARSSRTYAVHLRRPRHPSLVHHPSVPLVGRVRPSRREKCASTGRSE